MTELEQSLTQLRDGFNKLGANGASVYEFILRNGRGFKGRMLPSRYRMRMPRMCYWNTYRLVQKSITLRYCEGFVAANELPVPIQHAWAIDRHDQVVDVTLQDWDSGESTAHKAHYFGIVFEKHQLKRKLAGSGMLNDYHGTPRLEVWYAIDPGFKAILEPFKA